MLINCTNKGCLKLNEAKLDVKNNVVICEYCGKEIENITNFMKKTLKSSGQILRVQENRPFQALCSHCKKYRPLYIKENKPFCEECNNNVKVSATFFNMLKKHLESEKNE